MKSTGKKILNAVKFAACLALVACMTFTQTAKATEIPKLFRELLQTVKWPLRK